jgi:hypothetical protein
MNALEEGEKHEGKNPPCALRCPPFDKGGGGGAHRGGERIHTAAEKHRRRRAGADH